MHFLVFFALMTVTATRQLITSHSNNHLTATINKTSEASSSTTPAGISSSDGNITVDGGRGINDDQYGNLCVNIGQSQMARDVVMLFHAFRLLFVTLKTSRHQWFPLFSSNFILKAPGYHKTTCAKCITGDAFITLGFWLGIRRNAMKLSQNEIINE